MQRKVNLYPQKHPLSIHPEQNEPVEKQYDDALKQRSVGSAEECEESFTGNEIKHAAHESAEGVCNEVGGDGVHPYYDKRERPFLELYGVYYGVECRQ